MDAWEILADGSTLDTGDAWERLNELGTAGGGLLILSDGLELEVEENNFDVSVDLGGISLSVDDEELIIEIDDDNVVVEMELADV